jgi:hypothetical protein
MIDIAIDANILLIYNINQLILKYLYTKKNLTV